MLLQRTLALAAAVRGIAAVTLSVDFGQSGNASSPLLHGFIIEDINHSIDGGLHGQALQNNGFQGDSPGLNAYAAVGAANISQDTANPLNGAITSTLFISPQSGATGQVGASNEGYFGLRVPIDDVWANYFFVKGDFDDNVTVSIVGQNSGTVYGTTDVPVQGDPDSFSYYVTSISTSAANEPCMWTFTFDAASAPNGLNLGLPQLYPTTFNRRYNGLNPELADTLNAMGGTFLRFPGGNNLEGQSAANRWQWNATIGNVEDRPGRQGDWGYPNTDAMGLLEYFYWTEDMNLEPLLAIWDGHDLGGGSITGDALTPYIDDVLNELEYCLGDSSTTYGAMRAAQGHPDPFKLNYIEIGNEDFLSSGADTYQERFDAFTSAILQRYPDLHMISSIAPQDGTSISTPAGTYLDVHHYLSPTDMVASFNEFDNWDRQYPILVGEYSCQVDDSGNAWEYSSMQAGAAEAVYTLGLERNSDIVKMACYAPVIQRFEDSQWHPNLIGLDTANGVTRSVSYFVQQMFATNHGDTVLPVTADAAFGPLYWSASSAGSTTIFKVVNYGGDDQAVDLTIAGASSATVTTLSAAEGDVNTPGNETVVPVGSSLDASDGVFSFTLPAWGFMVLVATP